MSILFWLDDECVLSLDGVAIHPREGDTVRLDHGSHQGYYRVKSLLWSYRQIPSEIAPMQDNRLEVHLERQDL